MLYYYIASVSSTAAGLCVSAAGFWRQRAPAARRGGGDTGATGDR